MKNLAIQSLKNHSIEAARLWKQLNQLSDEQLDEVNELLSQLWTEQNEQENAVDIMGELAEQIDAEIIAINARLKYLTEIHQQAIAKLKEWRERLDETIIKLNREGVINYEIVGKTRQIKIKQNPPSCEILINPEELPPNYQRVQTKVTADKKAITKAWKQGKIVEGTRIYQKSKVVYNLLT